MLEPSIIDIMTGRWVPSRVLGCCRSTQKGPPSAVLFHPGRTMGLVMTDHQAVYLRKEHFYFTSCGYVALVILFFVEAVRSNSFRHIESFSTFRSRSLSDEFFTPVFLGYWTKRPETPQGEPRPLTVIRPLRNPRPKKSVSSTAFFFYTDTI